MKVRQLGKLCSAVAKIIKRYDETGSNKDCHRKGRPRVTSAAEDKFIRDNCTSDCSPNKCSTEFNNRHISTSTVQRRLCELCLYGQIAAKKPLLKDINKRKRLAWAKKHTQWTLDRWKSVPWSEEYKCAIFGSNRHVFVRRRVGEQIISACVVPTVKYGGEGVIVCGWFTGNTVSDLFRIQGTLNQHGYHSILQRYAIPSGLHLVRLSFVFQQDNDAKHTSRLCKGYLIKKESGGLLHQMTWPPQSPDLNPIEMVWNELDR